MKKIFIVLMLVIMIISINFSQELKTFNRKSLFIFPIKYDTTIKDKVLSDSRKHFIQYQIYKMFVKDFKRIDFFEVKKNNALDKFLNDAEGFMRKNSREIAAKRLDKDQKFKEAMVTLDDLLQTLEHSYAIVPRFGKIKRKVNKKKEVSFEIFMEFDIYNVKSKKKIKTIKANNKKSFLGSLMSGLGSFQVDSSNLKGLTKEEEKEERSFQSSIAGLLEVIRTKMKKMKEFQIAVVPTTIGSAKFGFNLGKNSGIKIDHRYKVYVYNKDGSKDLTGFAKIRKVKKDYSEAQLLIGNIQEGDQVLEDSKLGLNAKIYYGMTKIKYNQVLNEGSPAEEEITFIDEMVPSLGMGLSYDTGPIFKISELYLTLDFRFVMLEDQYTAESSLGPITVNPQFTTLMGDLGVMKKIYIKRFSLNFGAGVGIFSVDYDEFDFGPFENLTLKGTGYGITGKLGGEFLLTPEIALQGNFLLDFYTNPTDWTLENESGEQVTEFNSDVIDISSRGFSFNAGISYTF